MENIFGIPEETKTILTIFPVEVWHQIYLNIFLLDDYYSIRSASATLCNLLQSHRTRILFPAVVDVLFHRNELDFWYREQRRQLLSFREICKTWRVGMEQFFQKEYLLFQNVYVFSSARSLQKFQLHFDDTHSTSGGNPFLTSGILLRIASAENDLNQYMAETEQVLRKYGTRIQYLYLKPVSNISHEAFNKILHHIVCLTPNLKTISINAQNLNNVASSDDNDRQGSNKTTLQLRFPQIASLKTVIEKNLPGMILFQLLARSPNVMSLKTVDISMLGKVALDNLQILDITVPSKKALKVFAATKGNWQLKSVTINACNSELVKICTVLRTLEANFGDSLETVKLQNFNAHRISRSISLKIPGIRVFELENSTSVSLDFLMDFKCSLRELAVKFNENGMLQYWRMNNWRKKGELNFTLLCKNTELSNVWKMFPRLQKYTFIRKQKNEPQRVKRRAETFNDEVIVGYRYRQ